MCCGWHPCRSRWGQSGYPYRWVLELYPPRCRYANEVGAVRRELEELTARLETSE